MSFTVDDINNTDKTIAVKVWRGFCLGLNSEGKPLGSNSTWAQYKRDVGYSIKSEYEPRDKFITQRVAFKLFVRSNLDDICQVIKINRPVDIGPLGLELVADSLIDQIGIQNWEAIVSRIFSDKSDIFISRPPLSPGELDLFLTEKLGKSVPLTTKRRKCKRANIKYSTRKNKKYPPEQAQKIYQLFRD